MVEQLVAQYTGGNKAQFAKLLGVSAQTISAWIARGTFDDELIYAKCSGVSPHWILTGEGSMMDNDGKQLTTNNIKDGAPYYNVDFLGGFDEVFNDQTINPELSITHEICPRAQLWCNITGHSMEPTISNGDIIALRECTVDDIQYGEIYAVVMDTFRTVKMLRKSESPGMLRFVPVNTAEFDPQEFPVKRILHIFEVVGCLRRFF